MRLIEGRRLTGPGMLLDGPGVAVEVAFDDGEDVAAAMARWRERVADLATTLGGWAPRFAARSHRAGASWACSAPLDALNAAVEVAEYAVDPSLYDGDTPERLHSAWRSERSPRLLDAVARAATNGLPWLADEDGFTLGLGKRSRTWPLAELPAAETFSLDGIGTIPHALVTGTNGKTTTARLLARMVREAGCTVGLTSTDGLYVDGEPMEAGDWTGPGGARRILRNVRIDAAVLEAARGGVLRRGLATRWADAAVVTNASDDHLGEWGIDDVAAMAEAKLLVRKGIRPGGVLVLNAGNPPLVAAASRLGLPDGPWRLAWFGVDGKHLILQANPSHDADLAFVADGAFVHLRGEAQTVVLPVAEVPITFGGAALHNVENALAAILGAVALGLPWAAVRAGLAGFKPDATDNPGRMNVFHHDGATLLVDFAHNPDGLRQLAHLVDKWPSQRRLVVLGQAGDRSDEAIRDLARTALLCRPDHVVLKESLHYLRGRPLGEVTALLQDELRTLGVADSAVTLCADEAEAVVVALAWCQPGDLVLLLVHDDFAAAVATLRERGALG